MNAPYMLKRFLRLRQARGRTAGAALATSLLLSVAAAGWAAQPAGSLRGTVRDAQGQPAAAATVVLKAPGKTQPLTTHTADDGAYSFRDLAPGAYAVRAEKAGAGVTAIPTVLLRAGEQKTLDLVLQPAGGKAAGGAAAGIEFSEQPEFAVAGLTNWTYTGGHGSDSTLKAAESLTRETRALAAGPAGKGSASAASQAQLRRNLQRAPNDPAANRQLGEYCLRAGDPRQAIPLLQKAHQLDPHDAAGTKALASAYRAAGDLDEQEGKPLDAVRQYELAVGLDPSEQNYFAWGSELLLHRAIEPAAQVFARAHRAHPRSPRLLMGLGVAYYAQEAYPQAVRWLSAAADLDPSNPHPYLFLGKMESASPTPLQGVEREMERFQKLHPGNAWANYYLALGRWKRLRTAPNARGLAEVKSLLAEALRLDPQLGEAWVLRGNLRAGAGDWTTALEDYQQALKASPHLAEPHYRLALAYRHLGREADAQRELATYEQERREQNAAAEGRREAIQQFVIVWKKQTSGPPAP